MKDASTRTSHVLELQRRPVNGEQTNYKRGQTSYTFHTEEKGIGVDT